MVIERSILLAMLVATAGGCEQIYGTDICGTPYVNSEIYPFYSLAYNANNDQTRVTAALRDDRDYGAVRPCGAVFYYAGEALDTDNGEYFERVFSGMVDDRSFIYSGNGITVGHPIHKPRPIGLPDSLGTLDISQPFELVWDGLPLQGVEWVEAYVKQPDRDDFWWYSQYDDGATSVRLFEGGLSLWPGESTIALERPKLVYFDDGTVMQASYLTEEVAVELVLP